MDPMYKIGEALIGDGPELAQVKLSLTVYQIFL